MVLNLKEQKLHLQPLSRVEEKGITSLRKRRCTNSRLRPLSIIKELFCWGNKNSRSGVEVSRIRSLSFLLLPSILISDGATRGPEDSNALESQSPYGLNS